MHALAMLNKKIFSYSTTHEFISLWAEAMNVWEHYAASQLDMQSAGMTNYAKKWSSKSQPKLVSQDSIATIQGVAEQVPLAWQLADQCLLYGLEKPADVISEVLNFSKLCMNNQLLCSLCTDIIYCLHYILSDQSWFCCPWYNAYMPSDWSAAVSQGLG